MLGYPARPDGSVGGLLPRPRPADRRRGRQPRGLCPPTSSSTRPASSSCVGGRGPLADCSRTPCCNDYGQRFPEIFWLVLSARSATASTPSPSPSGGVPADRPRMLDELRYPLAQRIAEVAHRGETEALSRVRRSEGDRGGRRPGLLAGCLRDDLLPFAESTSAATLRELSSYLQGWRTSTPWVRAAANSRPASSTCASGTRASTDAGAGPRGTAPCPATACSSAGGAGPAPRSGRTPTRRACRPSCAPAPEDLGDLRGALRGHRRAAQPDRPHRRARLPAVDAGAGPARAACRLHPSDRLTPCRSGSSPRWCRYGLLYDLVEFSQILEELRRRGRAAEENAMRFMVRFLGRSTRSASATA